MPHNFMELPETTWGRYVNGNLWYCLFSNTVVNLHQKTKWFYQKWNKTVEVTNCEVDMQGGVKQIRVK